jgi:hypothetical protein
MHSRGWPRSTPLVLVLLAASGTLAQESPDERFLGVKEWSGHFSVSATGAGTLDLGETSIDYSIDRHLSYPLTLKSPGAAGVWLTCDVSLSHGTIDDTIVTRTTRTGCTETTRQLVSSTLPTPPGLPNPLPGAPPCILNGFQLQIAPFPGGGGTYTSWGFYDTIDGEQTFTSGGGGNCPASSLTLPWTAQFLGGDGRPICQGLDCLTLPRDGFNISQEWSFDSLETTDAPRVPIHYDVKLDLIACGGDAELIVEPIDYESWRPMGGESEEDPGNDFVVEAKLQGKGGCATTVKAKRFHLELSGVSTEPGVCMNWPPDGSAAQGKLDLAFVPDHNLFEWKPLSKPDVRLDSLDGSYSECPRAFITSFDWGGSAVLRVTADLVDGTTIVGRLAEDDATDIPIPRRKNGSKIAEAWKGANGAAGLADSSDEENDPVGDGHKGDGLFLYEEYRGFYEGDSRDHVEGNPKKKDLFIVDQAGSMPGIDLFRRVSGIEVHGKMLKSQVNGSRVVNFNRSGSVGNDNDQHALLLVRAEMEKGLVGLAVGGPALPAFVTRVQLSRSFRPRSVSANVGGSQTVVTQEAYVTAHELLHGCNVFHHGESGGKVNLDAVLVDEKLVYSDGDVIVPVLKEGPCGTEVPILPRNATDHLHDIYVATQGGKHSGQANCLLRYNFAKYYTNRGGSKIWRHDDEEPPGFALCSSSAGTGPGGCLKPRYGDASVGCCSKQICVNDSRDHTPGEIPASACGAGGGGAEPGEGGGQAPEPALEPMLSLAVDEQRVVTIHRGWPVLVTVQVYSSAFGTDGVAGDLVLTSATGEWSDALRFDVRKGDAAEPAWPIVPAGPSPGRLTLTSVSGGLLVAWISPEESHLLETGAHSLGATLDTTSSIEGWMGVAGAPSVEVTVADEPSPLPPALDAEKALTFARWDASRGAFDEALGAVDDLLARQPGLVEALAYRAEILELSGKDSEALAAYEAAMTAFLAENPDPAEWPSELQKSLDALQEKLVIDGPAGEARFRRGDANADGTINISDPIAALGYLFLGNPRSLVCQRSADTDDSGAVNITDAVYLLQHLFLGGAAPPPPFASCGSDETSDPLPCATQAACKQ